MDQARRLVFLEPAVNALEINRYHTSAMSVQCFWNSPPPRLQIDDNACSDASYDESGVSRNANGKLRVRRSQ